MYFIIGASSFIGRHLYDYCKKNEIDVLGSYYTHSYNTEWIPFDICTDELGKIQQKYLNGKVPDAVIICGANTSIDSCKRNENASNQLNIIGTKRIIDQANAMGAKTVFLSSEAVFDGNKGLYSEEDVPNPITLYGRQKLQVEQYITHHIQEYLIFRVSRVSGSCYGEKDIFDEFYNKILNQEEIICLKNQSFCLTEVENIAEGIVKALEAKLSGLYNLSSGNYISRYELAKLYVEKIFGGYEKIIEKEYDDIPFLDGRHIYGGLNGNKLAYLIGIHYMSLNDILDKYSNTYKGDLL